MAKKKCEKYFREDLERVNEQFHDDGTVSYETKKVSIPIHIYIHNIHIHTTLIFILKKKHYYDDGTVSYD